MTITDEKLYKVLIPTAGIGSRLNDLTKYLNKSLVSIENKPVLSRIIEMFPSNTEFVIALGYKGDLVKQFIELAYPDKKFYFGYVDVYEGEGSGLGRSILSCEKFLQQPFIFCSCDTIVTDEIPYPDKNIVFYSDRNNKNEYRTLKIIDGKVVRMLEKGEAEKDSEPYIGLACIKDYDYFWQQMKCGKEEAVLQGESYALNKLAEQKLLYAKKCRWFDAGNIKELEKTREFFKEKNSPNILPKPDESIWFVDNKVIKYSDNKNFIEGRVKRAEYLKGFIPEIIKSTPNMYCYNMADGIVLSKIDDLSIFKKLLDFSQIFWERKELTKEKKENFNSICKDFYYTKTNSRIKKYYDTFNVQDEEDIINEKKYPKLADILKKVNWGNLYNGLAGRFHGDFHFENILYDNKTNKFTFLDWRQNFGELIEIGDIYYDLAKLLHGLIICHELINKNRFNVAMNGNNITYSFERKQLLIDCEEYYYKWLKVNGYDVKKVKILTALIYLNIAALHHYPYCHLLYYLGKEMLYENI